MTAAPHMLLPTAMRSRRLPPIAPWRPLAVIGGSALGIALAGAGLAAGWPNTLPAVATLACVVMAVVCGALVAALLSVRRACRGELAQLERDYAALRRYTAGASHDMRAPMVTVGSYLELLASEAFGPLPAAARHAAERAARASALARSLVDATLAESTRVAGEGCAPPSSVDLNTVLEDVIVSLGADVSCARADLVVGPLPQVVGSESAYYRIFENLVLNAVRYREAGRAPRVEISAHEGSQSVEIAVRDDGCGIWPADRDRVFADRVRGANAGAVTGSGLGLATVRELVTSLGGAVWIDPTVTDGTCVRVRVPLASRAVSAALAPRD